MLRSRGVPIPRGAAPTVLLGDNQGQLDGVTDPGAFCEKKHSHVACHCTRECEASGIVESRKIDAKHDASDPFPKALDKILFRNHFGCIFCPSAKVARRRMGKKREVKRGL
jgi:hypothetical protein